MTNVGPPTEPTTQSFTIHRKRWRSSGAQWPAKTPWSSSSTLPGSTPTSTRSSRRWSWGTTLHSMSTDGPCRLWWRGERQFVSRTRFHNDKFCFIRDRQLTNLRVLGTAGHWLMDNNNNSVSPVSLKIKSNNFTCMCSQIAWRQLKISHRLLFKKSFFLKKKKKE